jgi:hypothetical protein
VTLNSIPDISSNSIGLTATLINHHLHRSAPKRSVNYIALPGCAPFDRYCFAAVTTYSWYCQLSVITCVPLHMARTLPGLRGRWVSETVARYSCASGDESVSRGGRSLELERRFDGD